MSVLVIIDKKEKSFSSLSLEAVSYGAELAKNMNQEVFVASFGKLDDAQCTQIANANGANIISVNNLEGSLFDDALFTCIANELVSEKEANIIVCANTFPLKSIAPRLAVKLDASFISNVEGLNKDNPISIFLKKVYTGKALSYVKALSKKIILTVSPNSFGVHNIPQEYNVENFDGTKGESSTLELIERDMGEDKLLLEEANIVVSGGRGMRGPENWPLLEEFASLLGAATACSRPVADENWRPEDEHVGQTGKIIAPSLYFALGISGAIQHMGGISGSKCIVAVNKDPEASIFKFANYGMVADLQKVLPKFIEVLKNK
ncbi:MAG: electron transfer flavoprotein subunit alpha/FixB family protein [Bacteroidales bacterium]